MERLAQDNPTQRQTIVNVLCAYLRMPYDPPDREPGAKDSPVARAEHRDLVQEQEVRLTAQDVLSRHLRLDGRLEKAPVTFWPDIHLDLTGATLIDFDLARSHLHTGRFVGACFTGNTTFHTAQFTGNATFEAATFAGEAEFDHVTFGRDTVFTAASFAESADFAGSFLKGDAHFGSARFHGVANFSCTRFTTRPLGIAGMENPTGEARFTHVLFADAARFFDAQFDGGAEFTQAEFKGEADFRDAVFRDRVRFEDARFSEELGFNHLKPRGANVG